jgi:S-DNA-T family DNA segregation ATPase FtsK/SpoIIIE
MSVIEQNMDYTTAYATRSNAVDYDKIRTVVESLRMDVACDKCVGGISYQYYLRPSKLTDYNRLVKSVKLFEVMFGGNIRMYIDNGYVILEVPGAGNTIHVADIMRDVQYCNSTSLTVAIGKRMDFSNVMADVATMPHMLVAGTTGSGKSIFMHQLILSLLIRHPHDLQLYLLDPKMVEFPVYSSLRSCNVVSTTQGAVELLSNLCGEMDRRYQLLSRGGHRDIDSYNSLHKNKPMGRIVVFIDELADLMLTARKNVEASIVRLAQKARACGIHLIIATQRPDRNIVTGLIKTNIPVKACLKVNSNVDSRIVLDRCGAERLVGKGDMLYLGEGMLEPLHVQTGYVSEREIRNVVHALGR